MKKISILFIFPLFIATILCLYFFYTYTSIKKDMIRIEKENAYYKNAFEQNKKIVTSLQAQRQEQLKTKEKKDTGVRFTTTSQHTEGKEIISFFVSGPEQVSFDAIDLGLTMINVADSTTCTKGEVFSNYPLLSIKNSTIRITGIVDIGTEKIKSGIINARFATCIFQKKEPSQKSSIVVDWAHTHIYFLGTSILDSEHSFQNKDW